MAGAGGIYNNTAALKSLDISVNNVLKSYNANGGAQYPSIFMSGNIQSPGASGFSASGTSMSISAPDYGGIKASQGGFADAITATLGLFSRLGDSIMGREMPKSVSVANANTSNTYAPNAKISQNATFNELIEFIFEKEGGYCNYSWDPGGATNMGITQNTLNGYRKNNPNFPSDVKNLTKEQAKEIYYNNYYVASGADKLQDKRLALVTLNTAVHCGSGTAKKHLSQSGGDVTKMVEIYANYLKGCKAITQARKGWDNRIISMCSSIGIQHTDSMSLYS